MTREDTSSQRMTPSRAYPTRSRATPNVESRPAAGPRSSSASRGPPGDVETFPSSAARRRGGNGQRRLRPTASRPRRYFREAAASVARLCNVSSDEWVRRKHPPLLTRQSGAADRRDPVDPTPTPSRRPRWTCSRSSPGYFARVPTGGPAAGGGRRRVLRARHRGRLSRHRPRLVDGRLRRYGERG